MADRTCVVEGCGKTLCPKEGRMCSRHYRFNRLYGDPLVTMYPQGTPAERFWVYVQRGEADGACWRWKGPVHRESGYGYFGHDSERDYAHRFAYELFIGPVPEGLTVDHVCHNADRSCPGGNGCPHRACVNPSHLEAVPDPINVMRGQSPPAKNARKDRCDRDHELAGTNLYTAPNGYRQCKECNRIRARAAWARKQAAQGGPVAKLWVTVRERAFLIDAVMVLMHGMEQVPQNDLSEAPELQALLDKLMNTSTAKLDGVA